MKNFDHLFRPALLLVLVAGLIVAIWHLSWLHKQNQYEMQVSDRTILILDRQQRVVYANSVGFDRSQPIAWRTLPLP